MTTSRPSPTLLEVWRFVRGDMSPRDFEQWACAESGLEEALGATLYFDVINADLRDRHVVQGVKDRLRAWALGCATPACWCVTLPAGLDKMVYTPCTWRGHRCRGGLRVG